MVLGQMVKRSGSPTTVPLSVRSTKGGSRIDSVLSRLCLSLAERQDTKSKFLEKIKDIQHKDYLSPARVSDK